MPQTTLETQVKTKASIGRVIVTVLSVIFVVSLFALFGLIITIQGQ